MILAGNTGLLAIFKKLKIDLKCTMRYIESVKQEPKVPPQLMLNAPAQLAAQSYQSHRRWQHLQQHELIGNLPSSGR